MIPLRHKSALLIMGTLLTLAPASASACSVCFGAATDSSIGDGITLAILTLVGVTAVVWGGIGMFFINMRKRTRMLEPGRLIVTENGEIRALPDDDKRTTGEYDD